ncbi:transposase [Nocardia thraciensis]
MDNEYSRYELLARHLDPQFGNIYRYNVANEGDVGFDVQAWTPELREAVKDYLLRHCPDAVLDQLFLDDAARPIEPSQRPAAVDGLIADLEPWEIAFDVRRAAVSAVPTLHDLIGRLEEWPSEDDRLDAETWLEAHGDNVDWQGLARATNHFELLPVTMLSGATRQPNADDLVRRLTPAELLFAWEYVVGPAHTDLTDAEWRLLVPFFGHVRSRHGLRDRSARELDSKRRTLDALRFKFAHPVPWSHLPSRYGRWASVYQAYHYHQTGGLLIRLRDALRDNTEAADLGLAG